MRNDRRSCKYLPENYFQVSTGIREKKLGCDTHCVTATSSVLWLRQEWKEGGLLGTGRPRTGLLDRIKNGSSYKSIKKRALERKLKGLTCLWAEHTHSTGIEPITFTMPGQMLQTLSYETIRGRQGQSLVSSNKPVLLNVKAYEIHSYMKLLATDLPIPTGICPGIVEVMGLLELATNLHTMNGFIAQWYGHLLRHHRGHRFIRTRNWPAYHELLYSSVVRASAPESQRSWIC